MHRSCDADAVGRFDCHRSGTGGALAWYPRRSRAWTKPSEAAPNPALERTVEGIVSTVERCKYCCVVVGELKGIQDDVESYQNTC